MFLLCDVLFRDVEGRGKPDVQVVESSMRKRNPGAELAGHCIDHLGCSGLLGVWREGFDFVVCTSLGLTCGGWPHCSKRSRWPAARPKPR